MEDGKIYSLLYFKFQIYNKAKNIAKKHHKNKDLVNF